jgi:hypothetical protein
MISRVSTRLTSIQAIGVLQTLNYGDYHVTVVSPDTFTTFTPLLPCKSVFLIRF